MRADWEDRLASTKEMVERGLATPESLDTVRELMEWEFKDVERRDDATRAYYEALADGTLPEPPREPTPQTLAVMMDTHRDWLDVQVREGRISRDSPIWKARMFGMLTYRPADVVVALFGRARQAGRSPRPGGRRARRSGRTSRDGPDEPGGDDPDDVDGARRGWSP
jgi:hypothetical protein